MRRHWLAAVGAGLALWTSAAGAQGVGFLTDQERLASYCAGVSEARIRDLSESLTGPCAGSTRRECKDVAEQLEQAKARDSRLWVYLTRQIFTSRDQGRREKALAQRQIAKGNDDYLTCKRRDSNKRPEDLLVCRDSQGCSIDARFGFLDQ